MKKTTVGLLVMLLLLSIAPCKPEAKTNSSNWYITILDSTSGLYKIGSKTYYRSNYDYYNVLDINKDGCKELLLSTTSESSLSYNDSVLLLSWYKGKVKALKEFSYDGGGNLGYSSKKKRICFYKRSSSDSSYNSYMIKKGRLKKTDRTTYTRKFLKKSPYYKYIYKINGKKVSEKKWRSYSQKIYGYSLGYDYIAR